MNRRFNSAVPTLPLPSLHVKQYAANMKHTNFGDLLRARRNRLGISQRTLSERLAEAGMKIDPTAITRMETGQREPKLNEALALAEFLDIDLGSISYGDNNLAYAGAMESMIHSFYAARRELHSFLSAASWACSRYRPASDDPGDKGTYQDAVESVFSVVKTLNGREAQFSETPINPLPGAPSDVEFYEGLLSDVTKGLWRQGNDGTEA